MVRHQFAEQQLVQVCLLGISLSFPRQHRACNTAVPCTIHAQHVYPCAGIKFKEPTADEIQKILLVGTAANL